MPSPNPGGRPSAVPTVAKKILAETNNFAEVVAFVLDVLRGKAGEELEDGKSRRWAAEWLADRCLGRPAQRIDVSTSDAPRAVDYSILTDDELAQLEQITSKLQLAAAQPQASGDGGDHVH